MAFSLTWLAVDLTEPRFKPWLGRPLVLKYLFSLTVSLFGLLLSYQIRSYVGNYVFDVCQAAVALSAWYGGLGPGLLTSSLCILGVDYYFMPPYHSLTVGITDLNRLLIFGGVALLTSSLSNQLRRAKSELELAHEKLEERIAERTQQLSRLNADLVAEMAHRVEAETAILEVTNREQRRLGQDLHDGLCQILAGVRLITEELKGKLLQRSLPEAEDAHIIESRLQEALAQADTISRGLYPVELESNGLMAALDEMSQKLTQVFRLDCRFRCSKPVHFQNSSLANHLYRIAQEAATNAIKSGRAKRITVRLSGRFPHIVLSVTDDGIGLRGHAQRKGMGMKIMEYRARMIHAHLKIRSRSHGCTRVVCYVR